MIVNLAVLVRAMKPIFALLLCLAMLGILGSWRAIRARAMQLWPVVLIGVAGFGMYVVVHLEPRYIGSFVVLFGCSVTAGVLQIPLRSSRSASIGIVVLALTIVITGFGSSIDFGHPLVSRFNQDRIAAAQLRSWGLQPGDKVARVSGAVDDLGVERIARVEVVGEVDNTKVRQFWTAPAPAQNEILSRLRSAGAKAVIATAPTLTLQNKTQWRQLANTRYWLWTAGAIAKNTGQRSAHAKYLARLVEGACNSDSLV